MPISGELNGFIRDTFRSVWALELLLNLKTTPERKWSSTELVLELRSSEHIVTTAGTQLVAAGLLIIDDDNIYEYAPASDDLVRLADAVEAAYAKSPSSVRRIIASPPTDGLIAFADAFRLKGK